MEILRATEENAEEIYDFQQHIVLSLADKSLFCPLTKEEIADSLINDRIYILKEGDETAAVSVFITNRESDRNLYKTAGKKFYEVMTFEVIAVAPAFRGRGIQSLMLSQFRKEAAEIKEVKYLAATVSPENTYSLSNFIKNGYEIYKKDLVLYGGYKRNLMLKGAFR